ncbi:MAG: M20/M25/M40 family metallo-hydrolase [Candidatus Lokiarchaeota archaeon]|nr:M20/M25/M40 family metallo-hydrolase [Candidatus Lokiarchaeota archaeon]
MANDATAGAAGKRLIEEVCGVAWTRLPGSDGEKRAQAFISEKMRVLGADSVENQDFTVHAGFFRWWPVISIVLFYASLAMYHVFPLGSLVAAALAIANVFSKLFSYEFLDVLFKAKPSSNAVARVSPRDGRPPKRILVIGGHADSNYEYPIGSRFGTKLIPLLIPVFASMVAGALVSAIRFGMALATDGFVAGVDAAAWRAFTAPGWLDVLYFVVLGMVPYDSWIGFRMISSNPVPGANDNLSGVAVTLLLLERFARPEQRPRNVELWFVSFGSEEGGMKGSKHAAKLVREALASGKLGAPSAWVVNFDSIAAKGPMLVARKEPLYRCTYVPEVYTQMEASAKKAGVDVVVKSLAAGTDSAPFGRAGIPATGIVCMGEGHSPANWHSLDDTPENIEPAGIEHCVRLGAQFIRDVDESLGGAD